MLARRRFRRGAFTAAELKRARYLVAGTGDAGVAGAVACGAAFVGGVDALAAGAAALGATVAGAVLATWLGAVCAPL